MNLSVKNVKFYDDLSEETFCFTGELHVDGHMVATLENSGKGGATSIYPSKREDRELIRKAEAFTKSLPAYQVPKELGGHTLPMDLDFWITLEIEKLPVS